MAMKRAAAVRSCLASLSMDDLAVFGVIAVPAWLLRFLRDSSSTGASRFGIV